MKKINFLHIAFLLYSLIGFSQVYEVPFCTTIASNLYGPMNSITTASATNRTAVFYPASQLAGITGQTLTAVYFKRAAATGAMTGTPNFKVYLKETSNVDLGVDAINWSTEITGATLVYNSDPTVNVGADAGWKAFQFSTNFTYTGAQNLVVFMEYSNTTALASNITWDCTFNTPCVSSTNTRTTKYINTTSGVLEEVLSTNNHRRPAIGFDFTVTCNPPSAPIASAITTTSATINWTAPTSAPADGYDYYLSSTNGTIPVPTETPTGTIPTGTTLNLSSLEIGTQYYLWIRSNCGATDGKSVWLPLIFRTLCLDVETFTETFEGLPTGASSFMPPCWNKSGAGESFVTTVSVAPMSPPNRLTMTATFPNQAFALMPPVSNLSANTHRLRFKAYSSSGTDRLLRIGYFTNVDDLNSFVTLENINLPGTAAGTAVEYIIYPGALPAGIKQLVFNNPSNVSGATTIFIDDVIYQPIPSCIEPTAVTVSQITTNSAQINWTNGSFETMWDLEYGAPGFTLGNGTVINGITTNPYVFQPLTPNTNYQFYIRAACTSSDASAWVGPFSFKTLCESVTSFTQNFEGLPTGAGNLPDCWSRVGTTTTVYTFTGSAAPMSPPNRLLISVSATTNAYAVLPPVSNLQANTHKIRFKAHATAANKVLQLGYLTNPTDVNSFVYLAEFEMPGNTPATAIEFDFNPVGIPAGVSHLALGMPVGVSTTVYVDDVVWEPAEDLSVNIYDSVGLQLYPNPVENVMTIKANVTITKVELMNVMGQTVFTENWSTNQGTIQMDSLPSGTYFVKTTASNLTKVSMIFKK